jgi:UDP:flavonoid glycosyltransferase YjiC (YdhE family)
LLEPTRRRVDDILASLGAAPLPLPYIESLVGLHDIFLQPSVPGFDFSYSELPANLHFIGALPGAAAGPLPEQLVAAMAGYRQVVLVTQGTVANHDLSQLIGPALTALAERDDVLVLVSTGGRPLSAIPVALPSNALAAEYLPFEALMPHIDLFISNGGYGAVTQAVSRGVPVIAAGTSEDKPEVNARIAWCGVGVDLRTDRPSVEQLRAAIAEVLQQRSYSDNAHALAAEYSSYDAGSAIEMLLTQTVNLRRT